jgi:integrase
MVTRTWSPTTRRNVIAIILAAFNHAQAMLDVASPLRGLKKPPSQPRLHSLSAEVEAALLAATDECFRNFLFVAIRTGLRPFCELARLTADHVERP